MAELIRLELGGGATPRGDGFVNLDILPGADVVFDLDGVPPQALPFADESVAEAYSSHALEHVRDPWAVLKEVARVCVAGAPVTARVPHWLSDSALCPGHRHTLGPTAVRNVCEHFRDSWWPRGRCPRRLELRAVAFRPSADFAEVRGLYPAWSEDQVLRFAPGAAHDITYSFEVVANG